MSVIPLKVWLGLAAVAALAFLIWHDHHLSKLYKAQKAETARVESVLEGERVNRRIEQEDRKRADESTKALQAQLDGIRSQPAITGVRCTAPRLSPARESNASASANAASSEREPTVSGDDSVGRDVSEGLTEYGKNCEAVAATLTALQAWEEARTH